MYKTALYVLWKKSTRTYTFTALKTVSSKFALVHLNLYSEKSITRLIAHALLNMLSIPRWCWTFWNRNFRGVPSGWRFVAYWRYSWFPSRRRCRISDVGTKEGGSHRTRQLSRHPIRYLLLSSKVTRSYKWLIISKTLDSRRVSCVPKVKKKLQMCITHILPEFFF